MPTSTGKGKRVTLIVVNLLIMAAISALLLWASMGILAVWTDHGHEQTVPDVKGMRYEQAVEKLLSEGLKVELSDSIFDNRLKPGEVVEQNPKQGTTVKPGRVVYLSVNSFSPKMVTVPRLTDMSGRQARSILEGLGISRIETVSVVSEYKDLVMGARYNGHRLSAGARVPVSACIVLEIGDGMPDFVDSPDSDSVIGSGEARTGDDELRLF